MISLQQIKQLRRRGFQAVMTLAAAAALITLLGWLPDFRFVLHAPQYEGAGASVLLKLLGLTASMDGWGLTNAALRATFYTLVIAGGLIAVGMGLLLTWRVSERREARFMATTFIFAALWAGCSIVALPYGEPAALFETDALAAQVLWSALAGGALGITIAALTRFAAIFPRPLTIDDFVLVQEKHHERTLRLRWRRALYEKLERKLGRYGPALVNPRGSRRYSAIVLAIGNSRWTILLLPALMAVIGALAALPEPYRELSTFNPIIAIYALVVAAMHIMVGAKAATEADRRRISWLIAGIWSAFILAGGVAYVLLLSTYWESLQRAGMQLYILCNALAGVIAIVAATAALIYRGALDARLVLRRATVISAATVLLTSVFAGIENLASDKLVAQMGLPANTGLVFAGLTTALLLGPLRRYLETQTDRALRNLLPATALAATPRRSSVIVFSDMVGYTALSAEQPEMALTTVSLFHKAATRAAARHNGRVVKTIGDAVLLEFAHADHALAGVFDLKASFRNGCELLDLPVAETRSGIHQGDVVEDIDQDIFGHTVNVAARVQDHAGNDEVLVTGSVVEDVRLGKQYRVERVGEYQLKNVPAPVTCFRISQLP